MTRTVVVGAVCGALLVGLLQGCGARFEVAKDKVLERIDSLLGDMDVKRKKIEIAVTGLKDGIGTLRKAKIKAQVSNDQVQRQTRPVEERLAGMDDALKTMQRHLATAQAVEIGGKTYTPQQVKEMANRLLTARKALAVQLAGFQSSQSRLDKVVGTLERKQQDAEGRLNEIEGQLAVLDSNRIALTAMKRSAEAVGGSDARLTNSLARLQQQVTSLFGDVEAELRFEDERWGEAAAIKEIDSVEALVARLQSSADTVSQIDRALAGTKR